MGGCTISWPCRSAREQDADAAGISTLLDVTQAQLIGIPGVHEIYVDIIRPRIDALVGEAMDALRPPR